MTKIVILIRCRQRKNQVKVFFRLFITSFDRTRAADHENLLFSLSKYFFLVKNSEKLQRCQFSRKTHLFENAQNFLLSSFFQLLEIFFSDSASKTE
jgi:hypothetical protein